MIRICALLLLMCAGLLSCATATINKTNELIDESNSHSAQAYELEKAGKYEKAVDEYVHAINIIQKAYETCLSESECRFPYTYRDYARDLYLDLANTQIGLFHYDYAIKNCKTAMTYSDHSRVHLLLGMAYIAKGEREAAWKEYDSLKNTDHDSAKKLETFITSIGNLSKSLNILVDSYSKSLKTNPSDANSYYFRGWIFYQLGKYTEALSDFSNYIKLAPNEPLADSAQKKIEEIKGFYR